MAGPDLYDVRNLGISLFIVAFFVTSYRCFSRYTKKLWWHDDSVAFLSMLCYVFFVIGITILADESSSRRRTITGYYIGTFGYHAPNWGARVSIILTLVRITPWRLQKKILLWVAVFFVLLFVILTVQMYWVCELVYPEWKITGVACVLPEEVAITQVAATVTSDAILIASPLMVIRGVHNRALRFRLLPIFSMSIATTLASVAHAVMVMVSPGVWEGVFGILEAAVSVIVCNMSVVIPAILRVLGVGDPFMQEDTVTPSLVTDIEIVHMSSGGIELSLPTSRSTEITDSTKSEGVIGTVGSRQQTPVGLNAKGDRKHRLTTQVSDGSLGDLELTKVVPLDDESDITDSSAQVGGLPAVKKDQDIETGVGGSHMKSDST